MSRQSAARHAPPPAAPNGLVERDTLDDDFLRDQLAALLASPTLARVADRHSEGRDDPADFDDEESTRATLPNVDTQLLREALRAGLK